MSRYIAGSRCNGSDPGLMPGFNKVAIGAADVQSIIGVDAIDMMSAHLHVASGGSAVAAVKVYASNSYSPGANVQDETAALVPGNWVEITAECVGIVAITGAGAQDMIVIPQRTGTAGKIMFTYLRFVIAHTSGAGTLTGWSHGREI